MREGLGEKGRYSHAPARSQYHARPSLRSKRFPFGFGAKQD